MLDLLLISSAYAQDAAGAAPSPFSGMIPLVFIFVVFYFLLIRPQQKKYKMHQEMINAVKRGDEIVTGGGIRAKISKVNDDGTVLVQIADGVEVTVEKSTISNVLTKPEGDKAEGGKKGKKKAANDNA